MLATNETNYSSHDLTDGMDEPEIINEIGYPVHVYFLELSKMYMKHVSWQWHPELEIIIVNHGEMEFITNDSKTILRAGQGVIINANVMYSIEPVDEAANCSMYSTVFHPAFLFGYGDVLISDKYLLPVITSPSFQIMILDEEHPEQSKLLELVNGVIADNIIKKFGYELTTKAKLCEFWITLINLVAPTDSNKKVNRCISLDESRTKDMILFIEQHFADKITLDDLASSVHISKSECCRCFKRALNLTPIEYLMKFRIFKAASMIQDQNIPSNSFSDLAFNVGFNNASYFNKVFKQYLGCTPSDYKRKIKTDPNFDPFKKVSL